MTTPVCLLRSVREKRQIAAAELARRAGVSRQTIYSIEDGRFVPNTVVALGLARALECSVEDLFSLPDESADTTSKKATLLDSQSRKPGDAQLVSLLETERGALAIPADTAFHFLPAAGGVFQAGPRKQVRRFAATGKPAVSPEPLLLAGCDPGLSLLAEAARAAGLSLTLVPAGSERALRWLRASRVALAGSHLLDSRTGEYNVAAARRLVPGRDLAVLTFARWETGLIAAAGNPKSIRSIRDLGQRGATIMNREKGSAARQYLDLELERAGIDPAALGGYHRIAHGHLPAAFAVANGWADCCLGTQSAARCFGLPFIPLRTERFDLVFARALLRTSQGQTLANLINSAALRDKLRTVAGYETAHSGELVA